MRKTGLFLLFAATLVLGACSKNDTTPTGPTVTINQDKTTGNEGETVIFTVSLSAESGSYLKTLAISDASGRLLDSTFASKTSSINSFGYVYTIPAGTAGSTITVTFTAAEDNAVTTTVNKTITVTSPTSDINSYSAVLLGNYHDSHGSFFSSSNGNVYNISTSKQNVNLIDMIFFYGATNKATLAAPNDGSFDAGSGQIPDGVDGWSHRNATTFKTTSLSDLSSITNSTAITSAYTNGTDFSPNSRANNLSQGQVIAFQTEGHKMGLAYISQISGTDTNGNGTMTINVVVQK